MPLTAEPDGGLPLAVWSPITFTVTPVTAADTTPLERPEGSSITPSLAWFASPCPPSFSGMVTSPVELSICA